MAENIQRRTVTVIASALEDIVRRLRRSPARIIRCNAGRSLSREAIEYLVGRARPLFRPPEQGTIVLFSSISSPDDLPGDVTRLRHSLRTLEDHGETPFVLLDVGSSTGQITAGLLREDPGVENNIDPLHSIKVVGRGIERIPLVDEERGQEPFTTSDNGKTRSDRFAEEVWSRSIGALGEEAWTALRGLQVTVIGCGRSGSLLASSLVRSGVQDMCLIDPDKMEAHNLGEMGGVILADLGKSKSMAVERFLQSQAVLPVSRNRITAVAEGVSHLASWAAVRSADVVFSSVDNDAARLAASILAAAYLKPLIDIGTGIQHGRLGTRSMGADVRLILPDRCVLCFGGLANLDEAKSTLLQSISHPAGRNGTAHVAIDWRRQRAGSLRSLNGLAVALAQRLLEEFLAGVVDRSTWLHVEYRDGLPSIDTRRPPTWRGCPLCDLRGSGDAGLSHIRELLKRDLAAPEA